MEENQGTVSEEEAEFLCALAEALHAPADLVFIDGCHEGEWVRRDIEAMIPASSPKAVFVLHDAISEPWPDVAEVADEYHALILDTPRGLAVFAP